MMTTGFEPVGKPQCPVAMYIFGAGHCHKDGSAPQKRLFFSLGKTFFITYKDAFYYI